jgi:beta-lactamase class A
LKSFKFISPLIDVELPAGYDVRHEPILLKDKIEKFAKEQTGSGQVHEVSIYFRDLLDGPWFEINGNLTYNPASMMKVPIMVAWLKRAEKDPQVLLRKLTFDERSYPGPPQGFKPAKFLHSGTAYTVEDLLKYMMWYSDNKALWVLEKSLNIGEYDTTLHNMGVPNEQDSEGQDIITAHSYSGFFRILFNASFLNKEMSEKALTLLSYDEFPGGMAAGIPKEIKLASKFGEYSDRTKSDIGQLHEFGIVYHPKGPYILGILTRGTNIDKQLYFIKTVSRIAYDSVSNN